MAENGLEDLDWSEEHDCVPLKLRLKNLRAKTRLSGLSCENSSISAIDVDKNEDQVYDVLKGHARKVTAPACFGLKKANLNLPAEESHDVLSGESRSLGIEKNELMNSDDTKANEVAETVTKEKVDSRLSTSPSSALLLNSLSNADKVRLEDRLVNPGEDAVERSLVSARLAAKAETENSDDFLDDLDHVVLKDRRSLLLSRKNFELTKPDSEGNYSSLSNQGCSDISLDNHGTDKKENSSSHAESSIAEQHISDVPERNSRDFTQISNSASSIGQDCMRATPDNVLSPNLSGMPSNVKAEPVEYDSALGLNKGVLTFVSDDLKPLKSEFPEDSYGDKVDHMLLIDRINLKKRIPSFLDYNASASESTPPVKINRSRKKKRTVTDSIETAMEEDAPGLLKVLIDKGVAVNEIKLYGVAENSAAPDESLEESFSELEEVISKIFFQRPSTLKFGSMRCMKDEKPSYCLACLVALVEQARYLKFRKWPVEWGWCRDLQSFIFVFQGHHRIVLERPEYGYATYFFELVDSFTIDWQIKRLVTAMKLTSCGRITLIEDRSLMVGEDLSEGEARVLMGYGWIPSSGIGTMLNYRDRVVHDRWKESNSSEWRSKIIKLLTEGYNGGTLVSSQIPGKVVEFSGPDDVQVKLEI